MSYYQKIKGFIFFDTYGSISLANFLICAISGVFLALVYDVNNAYDSISLVMISNPMGSFIRNIHYWSADFFLIFSLLHLWEYLKEDKEFRLKKGVWLRVVLSIFFIFYVMLSGFILKADADSQQAFRIIQSLIISIPWVGDLLHFLFLGNEGDYQLLYVHHIATATIFIAIITFEHARTIWTKLPSILVALIIVSLFSYLFKAPLHNGLNPIIKGPWYFVGLQEILHWLSRPGYSLLVILLILVAVYYFPLIKKNRARMIRKTLFALFIAYLILTIIGYFFRGENWEWRWKFWEVETPFNISVITSNRILESTDNIPKVLNKRESCIICHKGMTGFSEAHNPEAIGCVSCHQGNAFSIDKVQAHRGMILIPGNLADANRSCGTTNCHPDITNRIHKSILRTMSGVISVDKYVFNETDRPEGLFHVQNLKQTAADNHLRDLCANCHLGNIKNVLGPISQLSRGGGCNACHLNYSNEAKAELDEIIRIKPDSISYKFHPSISLNITDEHCFGCHSRSGRIATNYQGLHETKLNSKDISDWNKYKILEDKRVYQKILEDVHHKAGMLCIDCHTSYETMGDGNLHEHKESQMQINCKDCHFKGKPKTIKKAELDFENQKIAEIRKYTQEEYLGIKKSGKALINTYLDKEGKVKLITKQFGRILNSNPPHKECTFSSHKNLSCESCHTAWVPQCIGCHNAYEKEKQTYDLLDNKMTRGAWIEYAGEYFADLPTLGIEINERGSKQVRTFAPGMILTIDKSAYNSPQEKEIFHRLFAPTSGHTTMAKGRSCKSCHNDPLAIGYGRGKLEYTIQENKGFWKFKARFTKNKYDGLPEDAWIGFLEETNDLRTTRTNMRPFNLEEQKRILKVGACLHCHDENSGIIRKSLTDYETLLNQISNQCILPNF